MERFKHMTQNVNVLVMRNMINRKETVLATSICYEVIIAINGFVRVAFNAKFTVKKV